MKIWRSSLVLALLTAAAAARSAEPGWVIVTGEHCNLHTKPDASSALIVDMKQFTPVDLLGDKQGDYDKVKTRDGKTGWANAKFLGDYDYASIKPAKVTWRNGPSKDAAPIFEMPLKDNYPVRVLDRQGDYVQIQDFDKDRGWISVSTLAAKPAICIVNVAKADVHAGAGDTFPVTFHAAKGVYLQVQERQGDWLSVKYKDGNAGFIKADEVWGAKMLSESDMPAASESTVSSAAASQPASAPAAVTPKAKKSSKSSATSKPAKKGAKSSKKTSKSKTATSKKSSGE